MKNVRLDRAGIGADGDQAAAEFARVGVKGVALVVVDDERTLRGRLGDAVEGSVDSEIERKEDSDEEAEGDKKAFGGHKLEGELRARFMLPVRKVMTEIR